MRFNKILSVAAVAAIASTVVSVSASAIDMKYYVADSNNTVFARADKAKDPNWSADMSSKIDIIYGAKYVISASTVEISNGAWFGGKFIVNSNSNGWKELATWGTGEEDIKVEFVDGKTEIVYKSDAPLFDESDAYAQVCLHSYGGTIKVTAVEFLDKDGNAINIEPPAAEETAAEETTTEETTAAADTTVEETVPAETEAAVEEDFADDIEADVEEEFEEETADLDINFDDGILIASDCDSNGAWGQAAKFVTYNNIGEDEEVGDDAFDVSVLNENNVVVVNYEADTAPELILQSWSGGEGWAKVPANEELSQPGVAVYTYDYMTAMYGSDDFSTVDAVYIGDTGTPLHVDSAYVISVDAFNGEEAEDEYETEDEYEIEADIDEADDDAADEADVSADEEAPAETEAPVVQESKPAVTTTTPAKTGNASAAVLAAIAAAAGAAAVAARKRK